MSGKEKKQLLPGDEEEKRVGKVGRVEKRQGGEETRYKNLCKKHFKLWFEEYLLSLLEHKKAQHLKETTFFTCYMSKHHCSFTLWHKAICRSRGGIHYRVSLLRALKFAVQIMDFGGHLVLIKLHEDFLEHFKSEAKGFWIS